MPSDAGVPRGAAVDDQPSNPSGQFYFQISHEPSANSSSSGRACAPPAPALKVLARQSSAKSYLVVLCGLTELTLVLHHQPQLQAPDERSAPLFRCSCLRACRGSRVSLASPPVHRTDDPGASGSATARTSGRCAPCAGGLVGCSAVSGSDGHVTDGYSSGDMCLEAAIGCFLPETRGVRASRCPSWC